MKVYLTTLGRLHEQVTLENLPESIRQQVILVVQDHEFEAHVKMYGLGGRLQVGEVRRLPEHIRTLGPTRAHVHEMAKAEADDKKYVLLDDDLYFYRRIALDDWHLRNATPEDVLELFAWVEGALDRYMHVGVSGREGNNRVEELQTETTRYMRMLCYRTDMPERVVHGRVSGMSDFDVNLQLLKEGLPSVVSYHWAQGHKSTQQPGGCSLNRTHETHNAEIDQMLAWHSPFVVARQKANKTGGEFGNRRELTIYWKKALLEGLRRSSTREAAE